MSDQSDPPILSERYGSTVVLRFHRPELRNPLSTPTLDQLDRLFTQAEHDPEITTLVLTGSGNIFASGADLREVGQLNSTSAFDFSRRAQQLFDRFTTSRLLTIAAVNGTCMGGALDLIASCKRRIASLEARFGHPGARLGIITGWGGTQRLPRLLGRARALDLMLTARMLSAEEALSMGLVDEMAKDATACALSNSSRR
jgi:enoyl-CoA hydratase